MQTTSYSLGELLRRAKEGSLTIPQFQREFVWRESQVSLLVDSMSRSYPIGSLLLLAKSPDLSLSTRSIQAEIREGYPPNGSTQASAASDEEYYILDGQQRTTSIARVFLNAHPKKLYYFDLKTILELHSQGETSWIRVRERGRTEPDRKSNNRLLRADIILDQERTDIYVSEYIEDSGDFPEFSKNRTAGREAAAQIKGVFEIIRNYKIPVVILERDSGVESICRVFETINSTGTRLTTFDLAVARFFPDPDLRQFWSDTQKQHPILKEFGVDGERVLQVLFLVTAVHGKKYPDPTRSNLLNLTPDEIRREWVTSSKDLAETYKWARAQGARPKTLPSHNLLVPLAAIRSLKSREKDSDSALLEKHDFIRRWYFSKVMQAGASQASNYRIGQDFQELLQYAANSASLVPKEVILNEKVVLGLKPSDVRYKSLQNVFATTMRHDLLSGDNIDSESVLHDHHIFPRNAGKKHGLPRSMLDGICNRVPVLGNTNQSLGEAYPQEYFREMANRARTEGTLDILSRRIHDCLIPGDPHDPSWADNFSTDRFQDFCRERARLIVKRVGEIIGHSLRTDSSTDGELVEDSDV